MCCRPLACDCCSIVHCRSLRPSKPPVGISRRHRRASRATTRSWRFATPPKCSARRVTTASCTEEETAMHTIAGSSGLLKGVAETLLLPLVARADAHRRYPQLRFRDVYAERILEHLDCDPDRFRGDRRSMIGSCLRAK